jgi:hypothetical protein
MYAYFTDVFVPQVATPVYSDFSKTAVLCFENGFHAQKFHPNVFLYRPSKVFLPKRKRSKFFKFKQLREKKLPL